MLALVWLNLEATGMAGKDFDGWAMERLHETGHVSHPVGRAKIG